MTKARFFLPVLLCSAVLVGCLMSRLEVGSGDGSGGTASGGTSAAGASQNSSGGASATAGNSGGSSTGNGAGADTRGNGGSSSAKAGAPAANAGEGGRSGTNGGSTAMGGTVGVSGSTAMGGTVGVSGRAAVGGTSGISGSGARSGAGGTGGGPGGSGGGGGAVNSPPPCPKPAGQICHQFVANDNSRNTVLYVDEYTSTAPGGVVWSKAVGSTGVNSPVSIDIVNRPTATSGTAVLVSIEQGYVELDSGNGASLFRFTNLPGGVKGAHRLSDGTTAVATDTLIYIISATGLTIGSFAVPSSMAMAPLRGFNYDPSTGNFWFAQDSTARAPGLVSEVTQQGALVWTTQLGAGMNAQAVWWRDGGGAFVSTGDPGTVVEVDGSGLLLSTRGGKTTFPLLDFAAGFSRLANGNVVVANWLGHRAPASNDTTPHLMEFDTNNKLVWQWGDQTLAREIVNVRILR